MQQITAKATTSVSQLKDNQATNDANPALEAIFANLLTSNITVTPQNNPVNKLSTNNPNNIPLANGDDGATGAELANSTSPLTPATVTAANGDDGATGATPVNSATALIQGPTVTNDTGTSMPQKHAPIDDNGLNANQQSGLQTIGTPQSNVFLANEQPITSGDKTLPLIADKLASQLETAKLAAKVSDNTVVSPADVSEQKGATNVEKLPDDKALPINAHLLAQLEQAQGLAVVANNPALGTPSMPVNLNPSVTGPTLAITTLNGTQTLAQSEVTKLVQTVTQEASTMQSATSKTIVFQIQPANLGPISVSLQVNPDQVTVEFKMEQSQTRAILAGVLPKLQAVLRTSTEINFQVNRLENGTNQSPTPVASTNGDLNNLSQNFSQQQHRSNQQFRMGTRKMYQPTTVALVEDTPTQTKANLGTISILA